MSPSHPEPHHGEQHHGAHAHPHLGADEPALPVPSPSGQANDRANHDAHHDLQHHPLAVPPPLLKSLVLVGLGGYFVLLWVRGDLNNYVNARYGWLTVLAGLLCFALGIHGISMALRGLRSHAHAGWGDHVHLPPSWSVLAIVGVPLLLGVLVPSQPLGAQAVDSDRALDVGVFEAAAIPATDSLQWTVLDWLRAGSAGGPPERINGKEADLIGFVYRREDDPKGSFVVMRFLMVHCAADAYAVGMPVLWADAPALPIDSWVRVRGTVNVGAYRDQTLPILTATFVEANVERPQQPYLYK
jgi:uncharacterized repeat protein (TIGR03943 family)